MLSSKDPRETITVTFDLASLTKVVVSAEIDVSIYSGIDENPNDIKEDTPQILENNKVLQSFTGGINGVNYLLTVTALSDTGEVFIHTDILRVRTQPYVG